MFNNNSTPFNMPVMPAYGAYGGGNGRGFGFGDDWLALIILLAIFGWGGNGFGGFGGYGGGQVGDNYILASDMSQLARQISDSTAMTERKLDGLVNGLSTLGYQELQNINGVMTQLATQGYETRNAITQDTIANMQGFNGVNGAIKDANYNVATQANGITNAVNTGFCQTNFNNQQNTRDILENQNANARAILDAINANKVEALKDRIAEQNQTIYELNLAKSQAVQNEYLIDKLNPNPCPRPAYVVQPPQMVTFPYNNNCGCGCA